MQSLLHRPLGHLNGTSLKVAELGKLPGPEHAMHHSQEHTYNSGRYAYYVNTR